MKRKKVTFSVERQVLLWLLVSSELLKEATGMKDVVPELFESSYAKVVGKWIWEYYEQTTEAPGKTIEDIYHRKAPSLRNEEELSLVATFLSSLSKEWEKQSTINHVYAKQQIVLYFKERSIDSIIKKARKALDKKDVIGAERALTGYTRIEPVTGQIVDLLNDYGEVEQAYNMEHHHMFSLSGKLGELLGPVTRGDFIGVLAPTNRGKTWWLRWLGITAAQYGFKTLIINLEQQKAESIRRDFHILSNTPIKDSVVKIPSFSYDDDDGHYVINYEDISFSGMDSVSNEMDKVSPYYRGGGVWEITKPAYVTTWRELREEIENAGLYNGLFFDKIVIDYLDLLGTSGNIRENRHAINANWLEVRGWCIETNTTVVTGSQSHKKGLRGDIDEADMAEDNRKLTHLTHMLMLNQNKDEYERRIMRVSNGKTRDAARVMQEVCVLYAYELGRPVLDSQYMKDVYYPKEEVK